MVLLFLGAAVAGGVATLGIAGASEGVLRTLAVDGSTDAAFLDATLDRAGEELPTASPNRGATRDEIRPFSYRGPADLPALLGRLAGAAAGTRGGGLGGTATGCCPKQGAQEDA